MPFSDSRSFSEELFDRFLRIVEDKENRPVLVHCEQGFHRTGVLVAAYRIAHCGWSFEKALKEMQAGGFELRQKRAPLIKALQAWTAKHHDPAAANYDLHDLAAKA